jgi:hypothetical protein
MRAVHSGFVDLATRLALVRESLGEGAWLDAARRPLADALRAVVLELAELDDARTVAGIHVAAVGVLPATLAYLERAHAYARGLCDALVASLSGPEAQGRVQARVARVLDGWEDELPLEVVFEVTDMGGAALRRRIHAVHSAWERSARGLVDRLVASPTWEPPQG